MSIDEVVASGWSNHESDPEGVFAQARQAARLIERPEQAAQLARLAFHVGAEHLDKPDGTLQVLREMQHAGRAAAGSAEAMALARLLAACYLCSGDTASAERELDSAGTPGPADRGIARSMAASVHASQGHIQTAHELLRSAVGFAAAVQHVPADLARSLAMTGNNIAAELEEEHDLDDAAAALMIEAATVGRKYWQMAGNWTNVERAEYRLASVHCRLGRGAEALGHARECLSICEQNQADAGELFFAHEILARAHLAAASPQVAAQYCEAAAKMLPAIADEGFRSYCQESLQKLKQQLAQ